jgi:hypothetical protein
MPDMMAIVSKAVFEREAPGARPGQVLPMRVYRSASRHLERLDKESRLFLVTVRPPNEALWLVAVLESPEFDGAEWQAARNRVPVTDVSSVMASLRFESGKGLAAKPGALGMSLQTPRVLLPEDAELLLRAASTDSPTPGARAPGPVNLTAHEKKSAMPCLCKKCLPAAPEVIERDGAPYFRAAVEAQGRALWFWVPGELKDDLPAVAEAVKARLGKRLKPFKAAGADGGGPGDSSRDDDGDDE